jgi:hypothetical protein
LDSQYQYKMLGAEALAYEPDLHLILIAISAPLLHALPSSASGALLPVPGRAKPRIRLAQQSIMANLVASVGMRQGWGVPFVRAAYRRWLQLGQETGSEPNLSESLRDVGVEPQRALALAKTDEAKAALMEETGLARDVGIFGSPTFVVGRELFWGDDRLEDAISWYRYGSVRSMTLLDFPEPDSLGG